MKKGVGLVFLVIIFLMAIMAIAGLKLVDTNPQPSSSTTLDKRESTNTEASKTTGGVLTNPRYVEFNSEEGLPAVEEGRRILFFYANWCPTCRPINIELQDRISEIPDDLTIIRVNYNDTDTDKEEEALANEYQITYQHTFVQIDEKGEALKRWNGGGLDEILSRII